MKVGILLRVAMENNVSWLWEVHQLVLPFMTINGR